MKEHEKIVREIYGGENSKTSNNNKSKTSKTKISSKKSTNKKLNLQQSMSTITFNSSYDGTAGSPEEEAPNKGIYHILTLTITHNSIIINYKIIKR